MTALQKRQHQSLPREPNASVCQCVVTWRGTPTNTKARAYTTGRIEGGGEQPGQVLLQAHLHAAHRVWTIHVGVWPVGIVHQGWWRRHRCGWQGVSWELWQRHGVTVLRRGDRGH
jgi:hypothetical protein